MVENHDVPIFRYKQAIVLRQDLPMSRGKIAAQAAHAAVLAAEETRKRKIQWFHEWFEEGQKKVVLQARDLGELRKLRDKALGLDLAAVLVEDRGLTEVPPGTVTALGVGPAPERIVDVVTGSLSLLK